MSKGHDFRREVGVGDVGELVKLKKYGMKGCYINGFRAGKSYSGKTVFSRN